MGNEVASGDFDLAEIPLVSPGNDATVFLPASFQWSRRPATSTDSYALTFRNRNTGEIVGQTLPLGYVDTITIGGLSSKMSTGVPYAWEVWALSPDGGYGISFGTWVVTFNARA